MVATNRANKTATTIFFMVQSLGLTFFKIRKNLQIIKISYYLVFDPDGRHKPGMVVGWCGMPRWSGKETPMR